MKSLVVYFSHTGENYMNGAIRNITKGNTEIVAEEISKLTEADLFKVEPVNAYPYNYQECCDVAKDEFTNNIGREIKSKLDNVDNYDVIYIGGPVWCGHYSMPIFTALDGIDFTGKTIKPFTTHEGSGLGSVMDDVRKLCPNAKIENGLSIVGSRVENAKEELERWCI